MMGGGRGIGTLTPTSTRPPMAIVGTGNAIASAKSTVPKINLFILLPPVCCFYLDVLSVCDQQRIRRIITYNSKEPARG
jgi:hypothetical protein